MQVGKFLKSIKRADQKKAMQGGFFLKINKLGGLIPIYVQLGINVQGNFFSKYINVQTKIRTYRREFFLKINKCGCTR